MSLKLYLDLLSQPSRALFILLKKINYKFEPKLVNLRQGEHFTEEYTQNVNRFQKVPVIEHNGFILTESVAILKYLSREQIIPENLYPKLDSQQQARVEEFLEWQHAGLRLHSAMFFRVTYLDPMIMGKKPEEKQVAAYKNRMENALEDFNTKWLGRGNKYIVGDTITVADLIAACELEQPRMAGYDPCANYPNIRDWMPRVKNYFSPYYEEGHVIVNKIIDKNQKAKNSAKL